MVVGIFLLRRTPTGLIHSKLTWCNYLKSLQIHKKTGIKFSFVGLVLVKQRLFLPLSYAQTYVCCRDFDLVCQLITVVIIISWFYYCRVALTWLFKILYQKPLYVLILFPLSSQLTQESSVRCILWTIFFTFHNKSSACNTHGTFLQDLFQNYYEVDYFSGFFCHSFTWVVPHGPLFSFLFWSGAATSVVKNVTKPSWTLICWEWEQSSCYLAVLNYRRWFESLLPHDWLRPSIMQPLVCYIRTPPWKMVVSYQ